MSLATQAVRLAPARGLIVLAGLTGSGKTSLLHELAEAGEPVLDLEAMASHRGSAFGGVGLPPQPTHAAFEAAVRAALATADPGRRLWTEDEGPFIGRVGLPPELTAQLAIAPMIELEASPEARVARVVAAYTVPGTASGGFPEAHQEELAAAIERSVRRIGTATAADAAALVRSGDLAAAVRLLLPAYDAAYSHRMARHSRPLLGRLRRRCGPDGME